VQRLERYEKTEGTIARCGPLFMLNHVLVGLNEGGRYFDSGTKGVVQTGGVRKIQENGRISHADFREQVEHVLGVPETHCLDSHGMCEGNGLLVQCPKRHYLHTPYTYYKPLVLDGELMPMRYGECGRVAFLDAVAQSYPGFIVFEGRFRLLEHCPICDRPGPVIKLEIQRTKGEEVLCCAEELRIILTQDIAR